MTPRSLVRRPLQVGGLLLATAALGTAVAPAASAMVDPTAPVDQTPEQAPVAAPRVLTNSPASYLGTPEAPVSFGMGKLQISVAPEPGVDAPETEDMSGAVVEVSFPDQADEDGSVPSATCTTDVAGTCVFPADSYGIDGTTGALEIYPGAQFVLQQVEAPSSGLFDLPADEDAVVHGQGVFDPSVFSAVPLDDAQRFAPSATPATSGPGTSTTGSVVFYDPLVTLSAGQPAPSSGSPAPATTAAADTTAPAAPVIPVVPDGSTVAAAATTAATAAPALATTGADVVPVAAVGGGLLVAGAAGLVLARRRAPR